MHDNVVHVVGGTVREIVCYDIDRDAYAVRYDVLASNNKQYCSDTVISSRDFFRKGVRARCRKMCLSILKKRMEKLSLDYGAPPIPPHWPRQMCGVLNMEESHG